MPSDLMPRVYSGSREENASKSGVPMYFGFGAAITGLHFVLMESRSDRRKR